MKTSGLPFYTADVFTNEMFGGNQVAVFPDAGGLDAPLMQTIARELNLSETVFIFPAEDPGHTRKLRIFTPGTELPFAGHPTLGSAFVLAAIGEIALDGPSTSIVFEEGVGPVAVTIGSTAGDHAYCELTAACLPELGPPPPPVDEVAAALSLRPEEVRTDSFSPRGASCGVPYFFVPLRDEDTLGRARPDLSVWERSFSTSWAPNLYPFIETHGQAGADFRARMFAPGLGVPEDPATGSAAAALAGYLAAARPGGDRTLHWVVDQGVEMGRPSRMHLECDWAGTRVKAVRVGGSSVLVAEARLVTLPRSGAA
jgi:trans-2,3-dihydro-3-hydroxyanthranilate isomerase